MLTQLYPIRERIGNHIYIMRNGDHPLGFLRFDENSEAMVHYEIPGGCFKKAF